MCSVWRADGARGFAHHGTLRAFVQGALGGCAEENRKLSSASAVPVICSSRADLDQGVKPFKGEIVPYI